MQDQPQPQFTAIDPHAPALDRLSQDDDWADPVNRALARLILQLRYDGVHDSIIYHAVRAAYHIQDEPCSHCDTDHA